MAASFGSFAPTRNAPPARQRRPFDRRRARAAVLRRQDHDVQIAGVWLGLLVLAGVALSARA
jgi:hypothetical protein